MPTLKELYTALKEDGAPVPDTYDKFHDYMTSGPGNGYEHRREVYEALKEDGAPLPLPSTYEEFSQALFAPVDAVSPAVRSVGQKAGSEPQMPAPRQSGAVRQRPQVTERSQAPHTQVRERTGRPGMMDAVVQSAAKSMKKAKVSARAGEMMRNYRLRRGGKDFDVPESEVMFYGGFDKWAQAHQGAPVRVYMRHRDGRRVHVPVSQVARLAGEGWYAEARRDEPRLPSESGASPHGGRPVTAADKAYYAHQLADVMQDSRARTRAGQQRVEGMTDYMRSGEALTGAAADDGMHVDPSDGQVKKRYLLPTGERTFDAADAERTSRAYRVETGRQREEARRLQHPEYEELVARRDTVWKEIRELQAKRGESIDKGSERQREGESAWDAFVRIAGGASARAHDAMHAHPSGKEAGISGKPGEERMKQLWAELLELDAAVRRMEQATKYKYNLDNLGGVLGTVENFGEGMLNTLLDPDTLTMGVTGKSRESELSAAQSAGADPDAGRLIDSSVMSASAMRDVGKLGAMDTGATVAGFFADPLVWVTGGVGGAAGSGVTKLLGKSLLKGGTRAMAARAGASQLSARLLPKMAVGAAHGAGTFGAYEGASALRDQIVRGGYVNPETGENEGYSLLPILNSTAHGVVMGGLTGGAGVLLGNVADKYVRAAGTAGKVALRGAEAAVSTVAEGTIFSIPEWIEGKRDAMDVWTDNLEMVAGFKAVGAVKGAPGFIRSLREIKPRDGRPLTRAEREHNNISFEERLDRSLDRYGDVMAFTRDELAEMRRYGYGDFSELFKRKKDAASQQGGTPGVPDLPGAQAERAQRAELDNYEMMERLMQDGRVSQAARAKAYFILTGRGVPVSTVAKYESVRTVDGAYVVNAVAADGEVVTSRTFSSEGEAKSEIEKIERQVELNSIELGERYQQIVDLDERFQEASRRVAAKNGWDPVEVYKTYEAVRDNTLRGASKELSDAQKNIYGKIIAEFEKIAERDLATEKRTAINEIYGVDLDAAIRKDPRRRTEAEKRAVEDYIEALIPQKAKWNPTDGQKLLSEKAIHREAEDIDYTEVDENGQPIEPRFEDDYDSVGDTPHKPAEQPIGRAVMKYQDRQVEVLSGRVVMTDDGAMVDRERSDATVVVRDPETGKVEMVSPEAILSYEEYAGAPVEMPMGGTTQSESLESGAAPQPKYTKGAIKIRNSDGTETRGWLTGETDENGNREYYVEGDLSRFHYASDHELDNILSEYIPDKPQQTQEAQPTSPKPEDPNRPQPEGVTNEEDYDNGYSNGVETAQNLSDAQLSGEINKLRTDAETLTDFGRGWLEAHEYEQQRRRLAAQPAPDPNASLDGPRHAQDVGAPVPETDKTVPNIGENAEIPTENRELSTESVPKTGDSVDNVQQTADDGFIPIAPNIKPDEDGNITISPADAHGQELTPLQRIPRDEKGEPVFELAENPETGWDALVEFSEGDVATAKEIADTMAEEKRKAYEKAQKLKPKGKTPTEILASKKANAAQLAQAENEYNLWQRMAGVEQSRQDAIRSQQEAEARRLEAERAEAEKAEREAREEAARLEREALEGIPEWHMDTPENARKRGARRFSGQMFTRQGPVQGVVGNEVEVKFSQKDLPKGRVAVIEASQLQPSHVQGQRNPMFFIDEAQPKNRTEAVSVYAAKAMAEGIRPQEITGSATAYTGAPTVNARGEVIQGNNRSDALRFLWENKLPQQQQTYKQYLLDNAEQFGIDPEAVNVMQQPVLVNMLDVDDAEAIRLGQMTAQDTESGGIERIKPRNVAQKLGDDMRTFANRLLNSGDEEASFGQLVDRNGTDVLKWMNQVGAITNTQYQSAFDSKGNLTAEAKNDLQKVLYQAVFKGGSQQLEEMFDKLPAKAQRAILSTAFRDMDSPFAGKMLPEIQSSIMAYNLLMNDPAFAEAKNMEVQPSAIAY